MGAAHFGATSRLLGSDFRPSRPLISQFVVRSGPNAIFVVSLVSAAAFLIAMLWLWFQAVRWFWRAARQPGDVVTVQLSRFLPLWIAQRYPVASCLVGLALAMALLLAGLATLPVVPVHS